MKLRISLAQISNVSPESNGFPFRAKIGAGRNPPQAPLTGWKPAASRSSSVPEMRYGNACTSPVVASLGQIEVPHQLQAASTWAGALFTTPPELNPLMLFSLTVAVASSPSINIPTSLFVMKQFTMLPSMKEPLVDNGLSCR